MFDFSSLVDRASTMTPRAAGPPPVARTKHDARTARHFRAGPADAPARSPRQDNVDHRLSLRRPLRPRRRRWLVEAGVRSALRPLRAARQAYGRVPAAR